MACKNVRMCLELIKYLHFLCGLHLTCLTLKEIPYMGLHWEEKSQKTNG